MQRTEQNTERQFDMIHRIVQFALQQRFLVLMLTVFIAVAGAVSFQRMPVDAYPDLSPPMVEIITQWPGHAAEEVERLVTLPIEVEMNGVPQMMVMRSISLYGLSDVILTFDEGHRRLLRAPGGFRAAERRAPYRRQACTPSLAPLFSPSGLVYRYVLESPDRSPQELKTYRGLGDRARVQAGAGRGGRFRLRRHGDAVPGAARSRAALRLSHHRAAGALSSSPRTTPTPAADFIRRAASSITCAASA